MQSVPGANFLFRRGAVYYFRRRVPQDTPELGQKGVWQESLGTRNPEHAKALCRRRAVETDREIAVSRARVQGRVSAPLSIQEAREIAREVLAGWLQNDAEARLSDGRAIYDDTDAWMEALGSDYREALAIGRWEAEDGTAQDRLAERGRWYPKGDASIRVLAGELLKARVRLLDLLEARQSGEVVEAPPLSASAISAAPPSRSIGGVTLGGLIASYRAEREREKDKESTDRKYGHVFKALEEALGKDCLIRGITRADCREVRDLLRQTPAHMGKRYPGLSIREAIEAADLAKSPVPRLAPNTVGSYINNLAAIFNWAVQEELLDRNPAKGLIEKDLPTVQRRGFTAEELERVFGALSAERQRRPWRFWVPALALYTGARAGELCQLQTGDVLEVDGTPCLSFSEFDASGRRATGKRLKTAASERAVPVHPRLAEAGFLQVVQRQRDARVERLFPELKEGPNGGFSHDLSKWFGAFLDDIGLREPSLVFHSFRHGFRDACRRAGVPEEYAEALGGWSNAKQSRHYGDAGMVAVLRREVDKVDFGSFKLPCA